MAKAFNFTDCIRRVFKDHATITSINEGALFIKVKYYTNMSILVRCFATLKGIAKRKNYRIIFMYEHTNVFMIVYGELCTPEL